MTDTPDALKTFDEAWAGYVAKGFKYGRDALQGVRLGFDIARECDAPRLTVGDAALKRVAELEGELLAWNARYEEMCKIAIEHAEAHDKTKADLAAARAEIERKDAALRLAAENLAREYESEYAGRTEVYCTACNARLTDGDKHHEGCEWAVIDAALAPKETNNG